MTAGQTGTRLLVSVGFITFPGERNLSQDDRAGRETPRAMKPSSYQAPTGCPNEGLRGSPAPQADSSTDPTPDLGQCWMELSASGPGV